MPLIHAQTFTMRYFYVHETVTLLLPLVIILPLHNHKQDVGNIGVRDIFSQFEGIFKHFHPIACISRTPTLGQNLEEKVRPIHRFIRYLPQKAPSPTSGMWTIIENEETMKI